VILAAFALACRAEPVTCAWPPVPATARPHTFWWWMGSAVNTQSIAVELTRYHDAGIGGVHIIPIYGVQRGESNDIPLLSPRWMQHFVFTARTASQLGLHVDLTSGSGWCFGGPTVTDQEANATLVPRTFALTPGQTPALRLEPDATQALMAFSPDGAPTNLLALLRPDGSVNWSPPGTGWVLHTVAQRPSGQRVKRAAPGGEGWMLNPAFPPAMTHFLRWLDGAFAGYTGAAPRAVYHDSFEYKNDWSPALLDAFARRRGYRLEDHLDAFLSGQPAARAARVKCDYRETLSDLIVDETFPLWTRWAHAHGWLTRNQAHGAPANWLDFYALADIPETEMFHTDRDRLISKFASSAAHVTGKPLVSAETGTWLGEHFTGTLGDLKQLLDDLFLSGVNHIFYHGTCYSPDSEPWPGWQFYASFEMSPRNSIWRDVPALNAYATRCQSVLQSGKPDAELLVYWPIHDLWTHPAGTANNLSVHVRDWFDGQPIGALARRLWDAGYAFDYVSDRQLAHARPHPDGVEIHGSIYRRILIPRCTYMPPATLQTLASLPGRVLFENGPPTEPPGLGASPAERAAYSNCVARIRADPAAFPVLDAREPGAHLPEAWRETLTSLPGLLFVRRALPDGRYYFLANRSNTTISGWVPLATAARSVAVLDPMTETITRATIRNEGSNRTAVQLHLPPGASLILRTFQSAVFTGAPAPRWDDAGPARPLDGPCRIEFIEGGPELPAPRQLPRPGPWTVLDDSNAVRFAGCARYTMVFDAPPHPAPGTEPRHRLDLGRIGHSARVRLNGESLGTLLVSPFQMILPPLRPRGNLLEIEVTNTSANRIRDLDRRGVVWRRFRDINYVNIAYQPFNAAGWPVTESGWIGPATLTPVRNSANPHTP
jgi:hypothetical protein